MKRYVAAVALLGATLALAGCGNGAGHLGNGSGGSSGGSSGGGTTSGTVQMGSGSGSSFQQGVLGLGVSSLSAGGSTTVSATLQNSDGTPFTQSVTVTFTSSCYQNGLAAFTVNGSKANTVSTSTGQANITYSAQGCSGADTITATANVNGNNLTATGTVTVAASAVGAIQFVSADPGTISLKGTGGQNTSIVQFKVTDASGGPVVGAGVKFSLNTTVGGLSLAPASATTGSNGQAQTIVQAGTQHTTVRVTATVNASNGQTISTQSPGIVVSTGLPTEKHFSLSAETHSLEAYDRDGVTDKIQVIMSDRFGNPVPDGTAVSFTTNAGQIDPSCTTKNGACSVTWKSANPRPTGPPAYPLSVLGHAEVLAYATGEESFTDANGDGVIDQGDQFSLYPGASGAADSFLTPPPQDDIGEIYLDQNENGQYDSGEYFFDFNKDGMRNPPDHHFHGNGCDAGNNPPAPCGSTTFGVGQQLCILMATSTMKISGPQSVPAASNATYVISDANNNSPPAGTQISISGSGASISGGDVVPDMGCGGGSYPVVVQVAKGATSGSVFYVVATVPSGLKTEYPVTVQ